MEKQYLVTFSSDAYLHISAVSFTIIAESKAEAIEFATSWFYATTENSIADKFGTITCKLISVDGIRINEGR